jgi:hypothetical protein
MKIQMPDSYLESLEGDAKKIIEDLVPEWAHHFIRKNAGYGNMHQDLGVKAQYVDMHRKVRKLKRALWDLQDIGDESPREVLLDLIGHCFLTMALIDAEAERKKTVETIQIGVDKAYGRTET